VLNLYHLKNSLIMNNIAKIYESFETAKHTLIFLLTMICFLLTENCCGFKDNLACIIHKVPKNFHHKTAKKIF